mmetsp:Transcript_46076/g.104091  ORF Transcript_46076/g.104091 Transcript_46076/m.104091 type:complete len:240 (-) Transcript_46076:192-911(-)|eukprot:CAMPEP_0172590700 /NCGR_PEP_ID=MMETSP1068-20121228/9312_1 /TAXON_ID=35684 /ORGANISM="Pseudopedinella elastica, Strain CCMP716" /LENGTH=239 /DNA_ID=CAMNT_0013386747 /DNA_START=151 /DNA_END=870 /DNA_ORIENTATION=+
MISHNASIDGLDQAEYSYNYTKDGQVAQRPSSPMLKKTLSIDGLDQVEFNFSYQEGDQDEILFAQSFPALNFCFLNNYEITIGASGVGLQNAGGWLKRPNDELKLGPNGANGTNPEGVDEFMHEEEVASGVNMLERYPNLFPSVYGLKNETLNEDDFLDSVAREHTKRFKFAEVFPNLAEVFRKGQAVMLLNGQTCEGSRCELRGCGSPIEVAASECNLPTLRGYLAVLDKRVSEAEAY